MDYGLILILVVILAGFAGDFWLIIKRLSPTATPEIDSNELVNTVISVAKEKLEGDKQQISADMAAKKEAIELLVKDLKKDIEARQQEIRSLEQDRNLKFGEITKAIDEHKKLTSALQGSTNELKRVLSNSQLRGSWGERQVEQIFHNAGFMEGTHYFVQLAMPSSNVRPDFTVMLPNKQKICIDAKFPFSNLQLMSQAEGKDEKQKYDKLFAADVKQKIIEIAGKGYFSVEDGTCDYAVMFVPSESVFEYINRAHPEIVDEALSKKVLMASPYSLVAIIRTINEAYRNFYYESSMREIIKKVDVFLNDYRLFQGEFEKFGKDLGMAMADYEKITGTRYKQMGLHIRQIQEARSGTKVLNGASEARGELEPESAVVEWEIEA
jgi:DNA recombination protein RmuC